MVNLIREASMKATVIGLVCVWLVCGMTAAFIHETEPPELYSEVVLGVVSLRDVLAEG
jgi:hypothetical protein